MDGLGDRAQDAVIVSRVATALFAVALLAGAYLRIEALGEPSYWLDEVLGEVVTESALAKPWWHWITGVHREHGPLYYAIQFASRIAGRDETAGRLPAALFGILTIPQVWYAARKATPRATIGPAVCALLLAASPLHVYYSREARPYGLLLFLSAMLVVALLRGSRPLLFLIALGALLYSSVAAAPVIGAAVIAAAAAAWIGRDPSARRRDWILAGTALLVTALIPLLYRGAVAHGAIASGSSNQFPAFNLAFLTNVLRSLTVTALGSEAGGRMAMVMLLFAIAGALALRRDRRVLAIVLSMAVFPAVLAIVPLWLSGHFFAPRYVAPSLIGFVILAGTGIAECATFAARWMVRRWPRPGRVAVVALALVITSAISVPNWKTSRREPFQKLDWRAIAEILQQHAKPGDVIATAEPYSYVSLRHYLRLPPDVHFVLLDFVEAGDLWVSKTPAAWLVTAGYSTPVSRWMCRYPLVLASPLEAFRLHYAPSRSHFLAERSTLAEQRALATALGAESFTLQLGPEDDVFLGEGWADAEVSRWATGRRSSLTFPRGARADRLLRFHAYPLTHSSLPAQTMRISLNGREVKTLTLDPEWRDYEVLVPAGLWSEGMNTLTFDFVRATAPSALDPTSTDARELSVAFDWIAIDDAGLVRRGEPGTSRAFTIRASADRFLDAGTAWRNTRTHLPASRLRRAAVEPLLARLGFDPVTTWPLLGRGDVRLDNVVETIAYGGDCEDHASFLRRAFGILLGRAPSADEEKDLLARLAADPDRVAILGRIAKSVEFRGRVLAR